MDVGVDSAQSQMSRIGKLNTGGGFLSQENFHGLSGSAADFAAGELA